MTHEMPLALQLVPLLIMLGLYTLLVKLSAVVCRLKLSWVHSLLFATILAVALIAGRMAAAVAQVSLSPLVGVVPAVVLNLLLGAWFLRSRATRSDGQPAGVTGGMRLSAVMVAISGGIAVVLMSILSFAMSHHG
jgi:hypothetical protein